MFKTIKATESKLMSMHKLCPWSWTPDRGVESHQSDVAFVFKPTLKRMS